MFVFILFKNTFLKNNKLNWNWHLGDLSIFYEFKPYEFWGEN